MIRKICMFTLLLALSVGRSHAQQKPLAEVFCGAELFYGDVNFTRLYNHFITLTPGGKLHLGKGWDVAAQAWIPLINEGYPDRYSRLRLRNFSLSKELRFDDERQYFKLSAGLFGKARYGADLRWFFPVNSWLLLHARGGYTNYWTLAVGSDDYESIFETKDFVLTGTLGASVWLKPWATELRGSGGRFLNKDYGVEGEIIRHFNHCSVSIFAQYHELAPKEYSGPHRYSGGFRIVMMLPPYNKKQRQQRTVVFRPASNFRLDYVAQSDGYTMQTYNTDPEENERTMPMIIPWGTGNFDE